MGACLCACKTIYGISLAQEIISGKIYSSFGNLRYLKDPIQIQLEYEAMTPEEKKKSNDDRNRKIKRSLEILQLFQTRLLKYKTV